MCLFPLRLSRLCSTLFCLQLQLQRTGRHETQAVLLVTLPVVAKIKVNLGLSRPSQGTAETRDGRTLARGPLDWPKKDQDVLFCFWLPPFGQSRETPALAFRHALVTAVRLCE